MTVAQINTYYGYGSTGQIARELDEAMQKQKIRSYVLYGRDIGKPDAKSNVFKMNSEMGFYCHKLTTHLLGYQCLSSTEQTKKAVRQLQKLRPDVVHLHNLHGHYLNMKVLFSYLKEANIPVVWTFHDCWPFTGHCAYFHAVGCEKWKTGCGNCPQKMAYPRSLFFDRSAEQWKLKKELYGDFSNLHIVTVSHWLEGLVRESFLSKRDIRTVYNGIDCSIFYPRESAGTIRQKMQLGDKKIILGVASGWTERKGLKDFLQMSAKLDDHTVILLVGKIPQNLELPENVLSYGTVCGAEEMATLYSAADVFVNPSRQETFGLTTAEAMACGTPSIVYDVTACPEVIGKDLRCGDCVKPYDVDELCEKVKKRLENRQKDESFLRDRVFKRFNKEKKIGEYIDLYQELCK